MHSSRYLIEPDEVYSYNLILDNIIIEKYIILISGRANLPSWCFDTEYKLESSEEDWKNAFLEVFKLVSIINSLFDITTISLSQYNSSIDILYSSKYSTLSKQDFNKWFEERFQSNTFSISHGEIKLFFKGYIELEEDVKINCELFSIIISRCNNIGITLEPKNLAFLPNHPICKKRQYGVWKLNAPKLAKVLETFNNNTYFDLLSESGDGGRTASISNNIYYLQNGPITGVEDENWDEFYIPFDLLDN